MSTVELSIDIPAEHEKNIFGAYDEHIKSVEKTLNVEVNNRNGAVRITGSPMNTAKAKRLLAQLLIMSERGTDITTQNVTYALSLLMDVKEGAMEDLDSDIIIDQTEDAGPEGVCRFDPQADDHVRYRACRYRQDLSRHGDGDQGLPAG